MILGDIRNYLHQRGSASLHDVAIHFDIAAESAQFALHYWEKKGKIRKQTGGCGSGGCGDNCSATQGAVYEWVRREIPLQFMSRSNLP